MGGVAAARGSSRDPGAGARAGWAAGHAGPRVPRAAGTLSFNIRSLDIVHEQAQQAIEPQAVALAIFGGLAALALLVLAAQALAQLLDLSAADVPAMRAVGHPAAKPRWRSAWTAPPPSPAG